MAGSFLGCFWTYGLGYFNRLWFGVTKGDIFETEIYIGYFLRDRLLARISLQIGHIPFLGRLDALRDVPLTKIGNEKCAQTFFAQTFEHPPGVRNILGSLPPNPRKTSFRERARTFRPPPLRVKGPHTTWQSLGPKSY